MRIHDEITEKMRTVDSVSSFIENIRTLQKEWCDDGWFLVYRGEAEEYDTPCIPTIFREFALKQISHYELNMFMAMRQNDISKSEDYLHNAIDAQHDGFPSRLLDVTYNSLIALYFAVTPYYYREANSSDNKDGIVYVFKYDKAYSPESSDTKEMYKDSVNGKGVIYESSFLSYPHILIDHCKQNKRIIAQQGAFILFAGEEAIPIPFYRMCGIRIAKDAKEKIRSELKTMFGIYTGNVYPEVELMLEEVKDRCKRFDALPSDMDRMAYASLDEIKQEYNYFAECCDYFVQRGEPYGELIRLIEKTIVTHKNHLKAYWNYLEEYYADAEKEKNEKREDIIIRYNHLLESFCCDLPEQVSASFDEIVIGYLEGANNE